MIARDLAHLHGDTLELARLGNNLNKLTGLTEKGQIVPGLNDFPDPSDNDWDYVKTTPLFQPPRDADRHAARRPAFPPDLDYTCDNWTSNKDPDPALPPAAV